MTYKGMVKDNVIILEAGAQLPNGARVVVIVDQTEQTEMEEVSPEEKEEREALVARMKEFGQRLAGRQINFGDL